MDENQEATTSEAQEAEDLQVIRRLAGDQSAREGALPDDDGDDHDDEHGLDDSEAEASEGEDDDDEGESSDSKGEDSDRVRRMKRRIRSVSRTLGREVPDTVLDALDEDGLAAMDHALRAADREVQEARRGSSDPKGQLGEQGANGRASGEGQPSPRLQVDRSALDEHLGADVAESLDGYVRQLLEAHMGQVTQTITSAQREGSAFAAARGALAGEFPELREDDAYQEALDSARSRIRARLPEHHGLQGTELAEAAMRDACRALGFRAAEAASKPSPKQPKGGEKKRGRSLRRGGSRSPKSQEARDLAAVKILAKGGDLRAAQRAAGLFR